MAPSPQAQPACPRRRHQHDRAAHLLSGNRSLPPKPALVKRPEVAWAGLDRLRENANRAPFDSGLQALIGRAETALADVPRPQPAEAGLIVCPWFSVGGAMVRTIALTARFDLAADVTLDELRAELIYPLDEQADRFFRGDDGGGTGG